MPNNTEPGATGIAKSSV